MFKKNHPINILSINCGSSSIKFSIFKIQGSSVEKNPLLNAERIFSGLIEEIGTKFGEFHFTAKDREDSGKLNFKHHSEAIIFILHELGFNGNNSGDKNITVKKQGLSSQNKSDDTAIQTNSNIDIVVHRFVHGGDEFKKPIAVVPEDIVKLKNLNELAPLHNPSNLKGLEIASGYLPYAKQVCVFDTAFHSTIPLYARLYPIPIDYYNKYKIQKYGFHGISYSYINNLLNLNKKNKKRLLVCHLGNGASICAIKNGISIDTSMGYTPLEGLMMGTRSGSIDPSIPFILKEKLNVSCDELYSILNKKSGLLGISKKTYDFKELLTYDDENSLLAFKMYVYRITKFIGQYSAAMNGIDALIFTGGIGENSSILRKEVCKNLTYLGIKIDDGINKETSDYFQKFNCHGKLKIRKSIKSISAGKTSVLVVHTDEDIQMVSEAVNLLSLKLNKK